jgi:hypothetical protein
MDQSPVRHFAPLHGARPFVIWEERKMPLLRRWTFSTLRIHESPQRSVRKNLGNAGRFHGLRNRLQDRTRVRV